MRNMRAVAPRNRAASRPQGRVVCVRSHITATYASVNPWYPTEGSATSKTSRGRYSRSQMRRSETDSRLATLILCRPFGELR